MLASSESDEFGHLDNLVRVAEVTHHSEGDLRQVKSVTLFVYLTH